MGHGRVNQYIPSSVHQNETSVLSSHLIGTFSRSIYWVFQPCSLNVAAVGTETKCEVKPHKLAWFRNTFPLKKSFLIKNFKYNNKKIEEYNELPCTHQPASIMSTCDHFCFIHNLTCPGGFGSKFEKLHQGKHTYGAVIYKNRYHMSSYLQK